MVRTCIREAFLPVGGFVVEVRMQAHKQGGRTKGEERPEGVAASMHQSSEIGTDIILLAYELNTMVKIPANMWIYLQ